MTALWTHRHVREVGVAAASGVALGVFSRLGDQLPVSAAGLANIGGPWLILAFALGALVRRPTGAVASGSLGLTCAVASYYAYIEIFQGGAGRSHLGSTAAFWLIVGSSAGAIFGFGGEQWRWGRQRNRIASVIVLAGALVGEGLAVLIERVGPVSWIVATVEIAVGLITPVVLLRHGPLRLSATATGIVVATVTGSIATAVLSYLAGRLG